jgi:hypothetical protein
MTEDVAAIPLSEQCAVTAFAVRFWDSTSLGKAVSVGGAGYDGIL